MAEKEIRVNATAELRAETGDKAKITGYAAVFDSESNDLGGFIEIIRKGAFDEALADNPDVSARVQHQGGLMTVGRTTNGTLKLSVDKKGLRYEATPPNTQAGRDIVELIREGFITKSSFAFSLRGSNAERWNFEANPPRRELLNVNLHDVAPVDGPAYEDTSVAVRQLNCLRKATAKPTGEFVDVNITGDRTEGFMEFVPGIKNADGSVSLSGEALRTIVESQKPEHQAEQVAAGRGLDAKSRPPLSPVDLRDTLKRKFDYLKTLPTK